MNPIQVPGAARRLVWLVLAGAVLCGPPVSAQSIILSADPDGETCTLQTTPNVPATFYILAVNEGATATGTRGAEFRIAGVPAGWTVTWVSDALLTIGDPFDGVGAAMGFQTCQGGATVVLFTVTVTPTTAESDVVLTVEKRSPPSNPALQCPVVGACDFTLACAFGGSLVINPTSDMECGVAPCCDQGECVEKTPAECTATGGNPIGDCADCTAAGACCVDRDGPECQLIDAVQCRMREGIFLGDGSSCDDFECAPLLAECGNDTVEPPDEECDGVEDEACPGECIAPGMLGECRCPGSPFCGDGVVNQVGEQCDGSADAACPGQCVPPGGLLECLCLTGVGACCSNGPGLETECIVTSEADCLANHHLYLGDGQACDETIDCAPLLATMESMSARAIAGGVVVRWTTSAEFDTIGFRLLRETVDSTREKRIEVAVELVPSAGHGLTGASYEVLDDTRTSIRAVNYYIEDIDIQGRVTRHGPIPVDRGARQRSVRVAPSR